MTRSAGIYPVRQMLTAAGEMPAPSQWRITLRRGGTISHTLAPADVSHYYQRLAELSTLPFWQREEFTEPAGPERGHVWHWQDVYPELARSRQFAADAAGLQHRALIRRNPGLTAPAGAEGASQSVVEVRP